MIADLLAEDTSRECSISVKLWEALYEAKALRIEQKP